MRFAFGDEDIVEIGVGIGVFTVVEAGVGQGDRVVGGEVAVHAFEACRGGAPIMRSAGVVEGDGAEPIRPMADDGIGDFCVHGAAGGAVEGDVAEHRSIRKPACAVGAGEGRGDRIGEFVAIAIARIFFAEAERLKGQGAEADAIDAVDFWRGVRCDFAAEAGVVYRDGAGGGAWQAVILFGEAIHRGFNRLQLGTH